MKIKIDNSLEQNIQDILDSNGTSIINAIMLAVYPVGSIYMSVNNTNPGTLFGGTWVAWGSGQVPVGVKTTDTDFATVEKTGGSKTASTSYTPAGKNTGGSVGNHTLTAAESGLRDHGHGLDKQVPYGVPYNNSSGTLTGNGGGTFYGETYNPPWTVANSGSASAINGHNHGFTNPTFTGTAATITESTVQPYITCYMWKRTA